ncbi:MAG: NAD(P)-binding protein [Chitinophagaceae bacterium]
MNRKKFIQSSLLLAGVGGIALSCNHEKKIKGKIIGASSSVGHLLRDKKFTQPDEKFKKKIVIVGAGVSGLSAARQLKQNGEDDFLLIDLKRSPVVMLLMEKIRFLLFHGVRIIFLHPITD